MIRARDDTSNRQIILIFLGVGYMKETRFNFLAENQLIYLKCMC